LREKIHQEIKSARSMFSYFYRRVYLNESETGMSGTFFVNDLSYFGCFFERFGVR
jgi:hypothetical protein